MIYVIDNLVNHQKSKIPRETYLDIKEYNISQKDYNIRPTHIRWYKLGDHVTVSGV